MRKSAWGTVATGVGASTEIVQSCLWSKEHPRRPPVSASMQGPLGELEETEPSPSDGAPHTPGDATLEVPAVGANSEQVWEDLDG